MLQSSFIDNGLHSLPNDLSRLIPIYHEIMNIDGLSLGLLYFNSFETLPQVQSFLIILFLLHVSEELSVKLVDGFEVSIDNLRSSTITLLLRVPAIILTILFGLSMISVLCVRHLDLLLIYCGFCRIDQARSPYIYSIPSGNLLRDLCRIITACLIDIPIELRLKSIARSLSIRGRH